MNKVSNKQGKKEEIPQEIESSGRFNFFNGTYYIGEYKILSTGEKIRSGKGKLVKPGINNSEEGEEYYNGEWLNDVFNGEGVYKYSNGDIYSGAFKNGLFNGHGLYMSQDGTSYEGEFFNHKFHGSGVFTDADGIKWKGEFREGYYNSADQPHLKEEKRIETKIKTYASYPTTSFFKKWEETLSKIDKKNAKEQLSIFFGDKDSLNGIIKDPFPKVDEKTPDKWNEIFKFIFNSSNNIQIFVGGVEHSFKFFDGQRVNCQQFTEDLQTGQIIEMITNLNDRFVYSVYCYNKNFDSWQLIFLKDEIIKVKK